MEEPGNDMGNLVAWKDFKMPENIVAHIESGKSFRYSSGMYA